MGVYLDFWNGGGDDFTYADPTATDPHADPNAGYVNGSYNPGTYQQQPWNPATQAHWSEGMARGDGQVDPYLHPSYYLDPANPQNLGSAGFDPAVTAHMGALNVEASGALATAAAPHNIGDTTVTRTNPNYTDPTRTMSTATGPANAQLGEDRTQQQTAAANIGGGQGSANQDKAAANFSDDMGGNSRNSQIQQAELGAQNNDAFGTSANAQAQRALNPFLTANYMDKTQGGENQQGLITRLNSDLNGGQPSIAEQQLRTGQQANAKQALTVAAGAQGGAGNQAAALRQALTGNVVAGQDTNRQAATLRAQEYAQARQELGGATTAQRAGEESGISTAATAAAAARGADITSAANAAATATSARGQDIQDMGALAQLYGQQRGQDLQGQGMYMDATGQIRQGDLAGGQFNLGAATTAAGIQSSQYMQGNQIRAGENSQQAQIEAARAAAQAQLGLGYFQAGNQAATGFEGLYGNTYGQGLSQEDAYRQALLGNSAGERGLSVGTQANAQRSSEFDWQKMMQIAGAVGTGAALASDEALKTDVKPADPGRVVELLDELKPREFRYKAPDLYGDGDKFGVMAQMLERSAIGRRLVHETPAGKMVDVPQSVGALLAIAGEMHERLKRVEAKKARRVAA